MSCAFDESVPIGLSSSVFISKGTYCGWVVGANPKNKFHIRSVLSHLFNFANRVKRRPRNLLSCNVLDVVGSFAWVGVDDSFVSGWINFEHGINLSWAGTVESASKFCQGSNDERVWVALNGIVRGNLGEQRVPGFIRCSGYVQIKYVMCGHQEARALLEKCYILFLSPRDKGTQCPLKLIAGNGQRTTDNGLRPLDSQPVGLTPSQLGPIYREWSGPMDTMVLWTISRCGSKCHTEHETRTPFDIFWG